MTRDKEFYKQFFALYWVLVLHNVIILGVNLADNIMIGSYSETSLAGVAAGVALRITRRRHQALPVAADEILPARQA